MHQSAPQDCDASHAGLTALLWRYRPVRWSSLLLVVLSVVLFFSGIGSSLPFESHEAFYARSATEMMRRGDYVIPYFNEEPRLHKPPLNYWLVIGAHKIFGRDDGRHIVSEFSARAPSAAAGVGFVISAIALGALLMRSGWAGVIAGALALTSRGIITYAHSARPEMVYSASCSLAVVGLLVLYEHRHDEARRTRVLAGLFVWLCFALALLSKGPFLPLFILAGVVFALLRERNLRLILRMLQPWTGLALILLTFGMWVLLVVVRQPDALDIWRYEMFDRVDRDGSWWWQPLMGYYLYKTPILMLPWLVLLPGAMLLPWLDRSDRSMRARFLFWILIVPGFFLSFSVGTRWYYMLPVTGVLLALMAGGALQAVRIWDEFSKAHPKLVALARVHALLFLIAGVVAAWALLFGERGELLSFGERLGGLLFLVFGVGLASLALLRRAIELKPAAIALVACWYLISLAGVATGIAWRLDFRRSKAEFGREIAALVPPDQPILASRCEKTWFVHYADRHIQWVRSRDLADQLAEMPEAVLITARRALENGRVTGDVLLEETDHHWEACVLLRNAQAIDLIEGEEGDDEAGSV